MGAEHQKDENEVIRINNPNEAPVMLHSTHAYTTLFEILSGPFLRIFLWGAGIF
jgi:hypothetical protein